MMSTTATTGNEDNAMNGTNGSSSSSSPPHSNGHHEAPNSISTLSSTTNTPTVSFSRPALLSSNPHTTSTYSLSTSAMRTLDPAASTRSLGSTMTMNTQQSGKVRRTVAATRPGAVSVVPGEPEELVTTGLLNGTSLNQSSRSLSEQSTATNHSQQMFLKARRTMTPATVPGAVHVKEPDTPTNEPPTNMTSTPAAAATTTTEMIDVEPLSTIPTHIGLASGEQNTSSRSLMTTTSAMTNNSSSTSGISKATRGTSAIRPGAVNVVPGQAFAEPDQQHVSAQEQGGKARRNTGTMMPGAVAVMPSAEPDDNNYEHLQSAPPSMLTNAEEAMFQTKSRVRNVATSASTTTPGAVAVFPNGVEQSLELPTSLFDASSSELIPPAVLSAVEHDLVEVKSRKGARAIGATVPGAVAVGHMADATTITPDATEPPATLSHAEQELHSKSSRSGKGARNTGTMIPGAVAVSPTASTILEEQDDDDNERLDIPHVLSDVERDLEDKTRSHGGGKARNTGTMTPGAVHVTPMEEPDVLTPPMSLTEVERDLTAAGGSKMLMMQRRSGASTMTADTHSSSMTTASAATMPGVQSIAGDDLNSVQRRKDPRSLALAERRRSSHHVSSESRENSVANFSHESTDFPHEDNNDGLTDHQRMEAKIIRMEQEEEARALLRDLAPPTSSHSLNNNNMITGNVVAAGLSQRAPLANRSNVAENAAALFTPTTTADHGISVAPPVVPGTTQLQLPQQPLEDNQAFHNDNNKGLAVAVAVTERDDDEDDDHITRVMGVEYDPDSKPPLFQNRRFRLYAMVGVVLLLAVIAGSLAAVFSKGSSSNAPVAPTLAPTSMAERTYLHLFATAVQNNLVYELDTPHRMAANWIMFHDPLHLASDSDHLIQRYVLALFYLQMSESGQYPWMSCNPPQDFSDTNTSCIFESYQINDVVQNGTSLQEAVYVPETGYHRWLSGAHECTWGGVICDGDNSTRAIELMAQNLTGTLPTEIGAIPFLQGFSVPLNQIHGTIPSEYSTKLKHLVQLELHYNMLTGPFSDSWYQATNLILLNLGGNSLTGSLTSQVASLTNLHGLHLFGNHLTGTLPSEIGYLEFLIKSRLNDNLLHGTIPTQIGGLAQLEEFWVYNNMLTGTLPSEIGLLTFMTDLRMNDNRLNGTIPEEFYNLNQLQTDLDLSDMSLTGSISTRIGNLTSLQYLNLRRNFFTGTVPTQIALLSNLQLLFLHLNEFTGSIPSQICSNRGLAVDGKLQFLDADCGPTGHPAQACQCCTGCCDRSTKICLHV